MKKTIVLTLILSLSLAAISQENYFSVARTSYKTLPPFQLMLKYRIFGGAYNGENTTFQFEHFTNSNLSFQTGIGYEQYRSAWVSTIRNISVPFKANYYFGEKDRKLKFNTFAGIDLNFNTLKNKELSSFILIDENNNLSNATIKSDGARFMPSINTGLGVSYKFNSGVKFSFNTSLYYNLTTQKAIVNGFPTFFNIANENAEQTSSFGYTYNFSFAFPFQTGESKPTFNPEKHHLFFKLGVGELLNFYELDNKSARASDIYSQISIGYDFKNNFSAEIGYNWKENGTFYSKKSENENEQYNYFQTYTGIDNAFLRVNYNITLSDNFYLEPFLQVNFYEGSTSSGWSGNWGYSSPDTIASIFFRDNDNSSPKNNLVFGGGISANYRISNCFTLFAEVAGDYNNSMISTNKSSGYLSEEDMNAETNPFFTSNSITTGTNLRYNFGVKFYPGGFHFKQKVLVPIAEKILE